MRRCLFAVEPGVCAQPCSALLLIRIVLISRRCVFVCTKAQQLSNFFSDYFLSYFLPLVLWMHCFSSSAASSFHQVKKSPDRHLTHQNVNVHPTHVEQHIWTHAAPVTFVCLTFALSPHFLSCSVRPTSAVFTWNNKWILLFFGLRHDSSWFLMEPQKLWQPLIKLSIYQPFGYESPWTRQLETLEGGKRPGLPFLVWNCRNSETWGGRQQLWLLSIWANPLRPHLPLFLFLLFLLSVSSLLYYLYSLISSPYFDGTPPSRQLSSFSSSSSRFFSLPPPPPFPLALATSLLSPPLPLCISSLPVPLLPLSSSKTSAASSAKQMDVLSSSSASRHQPLLSALILLLRRRKKGNCSLLRETYQLLFATLVGDSSAE